MISETDTVTALLTAAGLHVPDNEIERLADLYPALRRSIDKFYAVDTGDEVQAAVFRADPTATGDPTTGDPTAGEPTPGDPAAGTGPGR